MSNFLVDPTAPPQANEILPGRSIWHLDAVMMSSAESEGNLRYAIINGKKVVEGARIDDATVLTIENARVEIAHRAKRQWLNLFSTVNIKAVDNNRIDIDVLVKVPDMNEHVVEIVSTQGAPYQRGVHDKESQQ